MFGDLFYWWLRQMRGLVAGLGRAEAAPDAVIVALDRLEMSPDLQGAGVILLRRNGAERMQAPLDLARAPASLAWPALPAGLRLPPGMVLQREVLLPVAAARDFDAVVGFEMDRLTPFAAGEVFWSSRVIGRPAGAANLRLLLLLVPREPVERLAEAMRRLGLRLAFVEGPGGRIELPGRPGQSRGKLRPALYGGCAVLGLACLLTPVIRQQWALDRVAAQITALAPVRREALALRGKLAVQAAAAAALAQANGSGNVLQSLAALTAALPDGTSLNDLTLKGGEITFDGQSRDAAGLIPILAAVRAFRNPGFTAPVTREISGNTDLFSIHATVTPTSATP